MQQRRWLSRNFLLLLLGQVSSLVGNFTLKFALSMYVLEQTGSAGLFAALLSLSMIPTVLLSPFGGVLADRVNRRDLMVALDLLSGSAVLLAGLLLPRGNSIAVIAVLLVVLSVLSAFESPTVQACIPQMLPAEHLAKGNAAVSQVQALASLFTPFLGGMAYAAFGLLPVLWGTVLCFYLTAGLECGIRLAVQKGQSRNAARTVRQDLAASVRFLRRDRPEILRLLLLAALVSLFVAGTAVVGFPYLVRTALGLPAEAYGLAESAMGAAAVLGSVFVGLTAVFLGFGLCLLPAGLVFALPLNASVRYGVLLAMFCLCQFGCSVFSTCSITVIQACTPETLMGKVMSLVFTLSMCAQPVGQIVYGALFDRFAGDPHWVLLPSGAVVCLIGLASVPFFAGLERRAPLREAGNKEPADGSREGLSAGKEG